jgi:hypothetical protein
VLSHATKAVGQCDDDLFGRALGNGTFRVATGDGSPRPGTGHGGGFDAPVTEDAANDGRDHDASGSTIKVTLGTRR